MRACHVVLLSFLAVGCATATTSPLELQRGRIVSDRITVGRTTVPLPAGQWEIFGAENFRNNLNDPIYGVVLVEIKDGVLARAIDISANQEVSRGGWVLFGQCSRTDTHAVKKKSFFTHDQDCYVVNHLVVTRGRNSTARANETFDEVERRGFKNPPTVLSATIFQSNSSNFVNMTFLFNPEIAGFPPSFNDWRSNDWHRDRISGNPQRQAYVKQIVEFAEDVSPKIRAALEGRLPATVP